MNLLKPGTRLRQMGVRGRGVAAVTGFDYYVDATSGSDSNPGTSALPWATLDKARTTAAAGTSVGLKRGQVHNVVRGTITGLTVGAYGIGAVPLVDCRQTLSGKTWTVHSGNVWTTTVTFRDTTTAGGTTVADTTHFGLWDCRASDAGTWVEWRVGGADIATNIAAVEANPGSWTIHRTGSTQQDPRTSGESATGFTVYVRLSDSADPNGLNLRIADQSAIMVPAGVATFDRLAFIGTWGKDSIGNNGGGTTTFTDCSHYDFGSHGWVGPATFTRPDFRGRGRPGTSSFPRANGGAINFYTTTYRGGTVTVTDPTVYDAGNGIYAHGPGTIYGYDWIEIRGTLTSVGTRTVIQMDRQSSGVNVRDGILKNGLVCTAVLAVTGCDKLAVIDSAWTLTGGGSVGMRSGVSSGSLTLLDLLGKNSSVTLKDTTISSSNPNNVSYRNALWTRGSDTADPIPTVTLDNVTDAAVAPGGTYANRFIQPSASGVTQAIHLVLTGGTKLGDLQRTASGTLYPTGSLTVGPGCSFGFGSRTGPQIEAALTAAGIPYSISHDTTIYDVNGNVLSSPGW